MTQPFELPDFYQPWPARLNPNLEAARSHAKAWAREMGLLDPPGEGHLRIWDESDLDSHDYALHCSYTYPDAPGPRLNLVTDWHVWVFYFDDYFLEAYKRSQDRAGGKEFIDRLILFMPLQLTDKLPEPTNPAERALADLWLRTAPTMSEGWRRRFFESSKNAMEGSIPELDNISERRLSNPIEYLESRRWVSGAPWAADLTECAVSVEIPDRIAATRPLRVLKDTFSDAVALHNDILSYQREVEEEDELGNCILVFKQFMGIDTQRAAELVNDLLTSRTYLFEHTAITEVNPMFEEQGVSPVERLCVLTYIKGLRDWLAGNHKWHMRSSRYMNRRDERATTSEGFLPRLTGLGTSAARIDKLSPRTLGLDRLKSYTQLPHQVVGPADLPELYMPFETSANPHLETARQHSKKWARRIGIIDPHPGIPDRGIWDDHRFDAADQALVCALLLPNASVTELDLVTKWFVWGTSSDDYYPAIYGHTRNVAGAKAANERLSACMPLDSTLPLVTPANPVERGLADLWTKTASSLPDNVRHILRRSVEDMLEGWLWELVNQLENRIPDPIDYVEMRRKTFGADLVTLLIRLMQGGEADAEIYRSRTVQELENVASDYGSFVNDIFSYQKEIEIEGQLGNGVFVIQSFLDSDRTTAIEITNNLMTARVQQFERITAKDLPDLIDTRDLDATTRDRLLAYVEGLKRWMCAMLRWQEKVDPDRYQVAESRESAPSRRFASGPTGLGTSAARLLAELR